MPGNIYFSVSRKVCLWGKPCKDTSPFLKYKMLKARHKFNVTLRGMVFLHHWSSTIHLYWPNRKLYHCDMCFPHCWSMSRGLREQPGNAKGEGEKEGQGEKFYISHKYCLSYLTIDLGKGIFHLSILSKVYMRVWWRGCFTWGFRPLDGGRQDSCCSVSCPFAQYFQETQGFHSVFFSQATSYLYSILQY